MCVTEALNSVKSTEFSRVANQPLSNCGGVGPCLWPISSNVCHIGTRFLALMKPAPYSASEILKNLA